MVIHATVEQRERVDTTELKAALANLRSLVDTLRWADDETLEFYPECARSRVARSAPEARVEGSRVSDAGPVSRL